MAFICHSPVSITIQLVISDSHLSGRCIYLLFIPHINFKFTIVSLQFVQIILNWRNNIQICDNLLLLPSLSCRLSGSLAANLPYDVSFITKLGMPPVKEHHSTFSFFFNHAFFGSSLEFAVSTIQLMGNVLAFFSTKELT